MENSFSLNEKCQLAKVTQSVLDHTDQFTCGEDDLDEFFACDTIAYSKQLMGKTYCWVLKEQPTIFAQAWCGEPVESIRHAQRLTGDTHSQAGT